MESKETIKKEISGIEQEKKMKEEKMSAGIIATENARINWSHLVLASVLEKQIVRI